MVFKDCKVQEIVAKLSVIIEISRRLRKIVKSDGPPSTYVATGGMF